jgi:hypothetical protein
VAQIRRQKETTEEREQEKINVDFLTPRRSKLRFSPLSGTVAFVFNML